jgi:hypothetical protein
MYSGAKYLTMIIRISKTSSYKEEPACTRHVLKIRIIEGGFPHSEILGSKLVRSSPRLIAAYHVFHRLLVPRHPPNALIALYHSHYQYSPLYRRKMIRDIKKTSLLVISKKGCGQAPNCSGSQISQE